MLLVFICLILVVIITILIIQPNKIKKITRNYIVPHRITKIFDNDYNNDKIIIKNDRDIYLNNRNTIYKNLNSPNYVNRVIINADGSQENQQTEIKNYIDTESPNNLNNSNINAPNLNYVNNVNNANNVNNSNEIPQNISMNITDLS